MTHYGSTCIARVLREHNDADDRYLARDGVVRTLLRPPAWTTASAWEAAGAPRDNWDNEKSFMTFTCSNHKQRRPSHPTPKFMASLRLARAGAINHGVFLSGSLTNDGHARVDAFVDRWHCRRSAERSGLILAAVLEHLARSVRTRLLAGYLDRWRRTRAPLPRTLLRPKTFLLLDMRRRENLHKALTAWGLLTRQMHADRALTRRKGARIARQLGRGDAKLRAAGFSRWIGATRARRDEESRRVGCFERWKLFVLLCQHNSSWGVERAMRVLRRAWLQHLAFHRLSAWRAERVAARVLRDALTSTLLRGAWVTWRCTVARDNRSMMARQAWYCLAANLEEGRRKKTAASAHYRRALLGKRFLLWNEESQRQHFLRTTLQRWARHVALTRERRRARATTVMRLWGAHTLDLQDQAFRRWKQVEVASNPSPSPSSTERSAACPSPRPSPTTCRCVRCLRKYGHMGGHANKPRSRSARSRAEMIVVTESRCDMNGHLDLQLRSARRTIDRALRRIAAATN